MNGEIYVVNLLKASERARTVGAGILGIPNKDRQLAKLREPDVLSELSSLLQCPEEKVFERFGERIRAAFVQQALPPFTLYHLGALRDSEPELAALLNCSVDDALNCLFDAPAMLATLRKVTHVATPRMDAAWLLRAILEKAEDVQAKYGVGSPHWGEIIAGERWLLEDSAAVKLRIYASSQNWPADDPLRILAAFLEDKEIRGGRWSDTETHRAFDSVALNYIRMYLRFIYEQLRQQGIELAEEAAAQAQSVLMLSYLPAWLEIYERGAVSRALPYLVPKKRALSTFLLQNHYRISSNEIQRKQLNPEENLIVGDNKIRKRGVLRRTEVGTFQVYCLLKDEKAPRIILQCQDLPLDTYWHLTTVIPTLKGVDISSGSNLLGECLLNTPIIPDTFLHLLHNAVKEIGSTFVQCLVLCSIQLPLTMNIPGHEGLNKDLPYKKPALRKDVTFLRSVNQIVAGFQDQYDQDDRELEIVGMP